MEVDPLTPLGRRILNEIKERQPEVIEPGWNNGVVELLNPVERGWRLLSGFVEVDYGD